MQQRLSLRDYRLVVRKEQKDVLSEKIKDQRIKGGCPSRHAEPLYRRLFHTIDFASAVVLTGKGCDCNAERAYGHPKDGIKPAVCRPRRCNIRSE